MEPLKLYEEFAYEPRQLKFKDNMLSPLVIRVEDKNTFKERGGEKMIEWVLRYTRSIKQKALIFYELEVLNNKGKIIDKYTNIDKIGDIVKRNSK